MFTGKGDAPDTPPELAPAAENVVGVFFLGVIQCSARPISMRAMTTVAMVTATQQP